MTMTFDTLTYSKELIEAGEKPEVAEVHAQTIRAIIDDELVTKSHLDIRLKELSNELRMDMKQMQHDLTLKLGGIMVTGIGVLAILIKVL